MKRSGFTLIELIFVIVIIGVLAAVAVPKFTNLKQTAEANNIIKVTSDMANAGAEVAVNQRDMEGNISYSLKDLVGLNGRNWTWSTDKNSTVYTDPHNGNVVADINMTDRNTIVYGVDCNQLEDSKTQAKCAKVNDENSTTAHTLTF